MKTILITGANRGLGLEFSRQYLAEGAQVFACCRSPQQAEQLNALQGHLRVLPLEVSQSESVEKLVAQLATTPIDIVINNAGVGDVKEPDATAWLQIFATNSVAPAMLALALKNNLLLGREKKLVTITSQLGSIANHTGGLHPYHASKAAVNNFMRGLSIEWRSLGIAVGLFHPGWVQTDMGGQSAPVTPEQSVSGLRQRIAELHLENSGTFRDYADQPLPW